MREDPSWVVAFGTEFQASLRAYENPVPNDGRSSLQAIGLTRNQRLARSFRLEDSSTVRGAPSRGSLRTIDNNFHLFIEGSRVVSPPPIFKKTFHILVDITTSLCYYRDVVITTSGGFYKWKSVFRRLRC